MGQRGFDKVSTRSIENVANDLIEWYQKGQLRRQQRSLINMFLCILLCLVTFPLGIVALGCYDILVSFAFQYGDAAFNHLQLLIFLFTCLIYHFYTKKWLDGFAFNAGIFPSCRQSLQRTHEVTRNKKKSLAFLIFLS